ncbi:hypothetical protein GCM10017786_22600 [Amycolatopsis deserti]|uniref:Uncharacterized protein n=1 Tax=Amycolatopsis deserti TaxID=185696 RepID=A0ABQ3IR75_9PSEU|nr:hypothetical protein GCM10017786_22600 [Amycolatopsis deserti]
MRAALGWTALLVLQVLLGLAWGGELGWGRLVWPALFAPLALFWWVRWVRCRRLVAVELSRGT